MALRTYANGSIFGERHGTGQVNILALHGWGRDRSDFTATLEGLDAVSVDLPGFGASPAPTEVLGAHGYAGLLTPVLASFDTPPVIVGHSFGGRIAMAIAAGGHPVRALVLSGVPLLHRADRPPARTPVGYRLVRWGNRLGLVSDSRLEDLKRRKGSEDYRAATGVMRDILVKAVAETYEEELRSVRCPVRMVWGELDDDVPLEVAERASKMLADASLDLVHGVGHHVPLNAPQRLRAAIEMFL